MAETDNSINGQWQKLAISETKNGKTAKARCKTEVPIAFFIHVCVNLLRSLVLQIYVGMINCSHCYNCKSVIVLLGAINEFEF